MAFFLGPSTFGLNDLVLSGSLGGISGLQPSRGLGSQTIVVPAICGVPFTPAIPGPVLGITPRYAWADDNSDDGDSVSLALGGVCRQSRGLSAPAMCLPPGLVAYSAPTITQPVVKPEDNSREIAIQRFFRSLAQESSGKQKLSPSSEVYRDVEKVFLKTFGLFEDRSGRDAHNLFHTHVKVQEIYEIHNDHLSRIYNNEKEELVRKAGGEKGGRFVKIHQHGYLGQDQLLTEKYRIASEPCNNRINETFLFHGTSSDNIDSIAEKGFLLDKAQSGLYGRVVYFAECSEKADQYTDNKYSRETSGLTMLLVKTLMGRTYIRTEEGEVAMPCYEKGCFTPNCGNHRDKMCTSMVAGLDKRFREILITDPSKCLPKFVIVYNRY